MDDGSLPHKQEVTLPFGCHTYLTRPNDPVKVTPGISHKPMLTGAGYTTFLWLFCHQTLYNPLCGITRDRCQVNLFKHQRDTSCLHSSEPPPRLLIRSQSSSMAQHRALHPALSNLPALYPPPKSSPQQQKVPLNFIQPESPWDITHQTPPAPLLMLGVQDAAGVQMLLPIVSHGCFVTLQG